MTKADIVNEIAKSTGVEKAQVQQIVESFMETIKDSLTANKNVYLRGFGSFHRKAPRRESGPQHLEEYHDHDSCPQHPGVQTGQELCGQGESSHQIVTFGLLNTTIAMPSGKKRKTA